MLRKLQSALPELIGRTIVRISVRQNEHDYSQLFLFFADGTHYEFYTAGAICGARHLYTGGAEAIAPPNFIPVNGMLEVLDRETATIVERPPS